MFEVSVDVWFMDDNARDFVLDKMLSSILNVVDNHMISWWTDGELYQNMNTRVPSEPRHALRKRNHPQLQQNTILLLNHEFEKLTIH